MIYLAASILGIVSLLGLALTIVTLPGAWLICAAAVLIKLLWLPELFSWWIVGVIVGLAVVGEIVEFAASAAGAAKGGGSRQGAIGAVVGTILGAILGTLIPIPVVGTVAGAVLGAGGGAALAERAWAKRTWTEAAKSGSGAAIGRLIATAFKAGVTLSIGLTVTLAAVLK